MRQSLPGLCLHAGAVTFSNRTVWTFEVNFSSGCRPLGSSCWPLGSLCWPLGSGCWPLESGCDRWGAVADRWGAVVDRWGAVADCWRAVADHWGAVSDRWWADAVHPAIETYKLMAEHLQEILDRPPSSYSNSGTVLGAGLKGAQAWDFRRRFLHKSSLIRP